MVGYPSRLRYDELRDNLSYDPLTGVFVRLKEIRYSFVDKPAGSLNTSGYNKIGLFGRYYLSSRLAWFYITGSWPTLEIDHRNRNRVDDRFINLRQLNRRLQNLNRDRDSKLVGVKFCEKTGRFLSKSKSSPELGWFDSAEEASRAYWDWVDREIELFSNLPDVKAKLLPEFAWLAEKENSYDA